MLERIRLRNSPPNITDGRVVRVRNTTEFGVTDYCRDTGYRAEGILEANGLLVSNEPLMKALDRLFVPSYAASCPATTLRPADEIGTSENASAVLLEVAKYRSTAFKTFTHAVTCNSPSI